MKIIANPYVVYWDHSKTEPGLSINGWCREHLSSHWQFIAWSHGKLMTRDVEAEDPHNRGFKTNMLSQESMLCLFECPKDALLFKLTWVENG